MTADAPDLVTLLYRADWTRLSLVADVSTSIDHDLAERRAETGSGAGCRAGSGSGGPSRPTGNEWEVATDPHGPEVSRSTLLVAPGGRYRHQGDGFTRVRDGDRSWRADDGDAPVVALPVTSWPLDALLRPSWLLTGFTLEVGEPVTACGRAALRVTATPRRGIRSVPEPWPKPQQPPRPPPVDLIEVIVDAELGILLRRKEIVDGMPLSVTELTSLTLNPAGTVDDDTQFQPPSGWDALTGEQAPSSGFLGSGWTSEKIANLAASRLAGSRSARDDAFDRATREDPEAAMPEAEPYVDGSPVSDEILHLLYTSEARWAPGIAATVHQWMDISATFRGTQDHYRRTGTGPGGGMAQFMAALGQQMPDIQMHTKAQLRIGGPDRYQVDTFGGMDQSHPGMTIVCDGEQRWQIYTDSVTIGPAAPLQREFANLFDGSWLLAGGLTGGTETTVDGRRGYRLAVAADDVRWHSASVPDEVVVDAEYGCLLRMIFRTASGPGSEPGSRVARWYELRDVTAYAGTAADFRPDIPVDKRVRNETPPTFRGIATFAAGEVVNDARAKVEGLLGFLRGD